MPLPPIESAVEIEPESFAASAVSERFERTDDVVPGGDTTQGADDAAAKTAADKAAADAASKAASDKAASDKAAELENPNLAATKKEEPVESDELPAELSAGMTAKAKAKAQASWKGKNVEVKTAKQQAAEADARSKDLQAKLDESAKVTTELEGLKKELDATKQKLADYEGEVYVARVESHPKFKAEIKGPMDAITSSVTAIATRYEMKPETLLRAIQEPDEAKRTDLLDEAIADLKHVDQIKVTQAAERYQDLRAKADDMRKDAGKRLEEMTREQQAGIERHSAQTAKDYRDAVRERWEAAQQTNPFVRKVDGKDTWNKHLDDVLREIEALDVNALPVETVAAAQVSHCILPEVMKVAKHYKGVAEKEKTRADAAEAKMKDYLKSAPGAGSGNGSRESSSTEGEDDGSFVGAAFSARQ